MSAAITSMLSRTAPIRPGLLYIVNSLNPGGTERLVMEMGLGFASEFRVAIICLDEPGVWSRELRCQGVPVHCLWRQPGLDFRIPVKIARIAREHGAAIIHAHQCTSWFYGALSRLTESSPRLLLEEHGRFYPEADKPLRRFANRVMIVPLTHRFVAVSQDVRRRLGQYEGLDIHRTEVIYNGVDVGPRLSDAERTALRREWGFAPDHFVVGTVGRFDPIKNIPMLLTAFAAARRSEPRLRGLLVGNGPESRAIRTLIGQSDLAESVQLTGFRSDARRLVQCMDLFVLSSLSEGTSMALLEAMAAGVPAVVTAVGGNPEIILDGESGWVVGSGATEALTRAMLEASRNSALRQRFALAGERRYKEKFTFDRMMERYRELYRSMLSSPTREGA